MMAVSPLGAQVVKDSGGDIGTASLSDSAVTTPKLADDAVTEAKILNGAVTTSKINTEALDGFGGVVSLTNGATISGGLLRSGTGSTPDVAAGADDLFVEADLEVDGVLEVAGDATFRGGSGALNVRESDDGNNAVLIEGGTANGKLTILRNGSSHIVLNGDSNQTVFNEDSQAKGFRVESDNEDHAFYVDAGDNVGIATSAPVSQFSVAGDMSLEGNLQLHGSRSIHTDSTDSADTQSLFVCGGGSNGTTRGACVNAYGNESGSTGNLDLLAGAVSGGKVRLLTDGGSALIAYDSSQGGAVQVVKGPFQILSKTLAQIVAFDPFGKGEMFFCTDCSPPKIVVSTGTSPGQYASADGGVFQ